MTRHRHSHLGKYQRGAALMVMIVIMVIGIATVLVGSLNSSALNNSRQQNTSSALAQAKDALIGYAASDSNRPGELPCPDVDGDGKLTMGVDFSTGSPPVCTSFVGYLPWRSLGLPELRDGSNEKLWYALSQNFYAGNTVTLNSDTAGQLSISGSQSINNVAAIIFSPGAPLCGKSHTTNSVDQYLEAMSSVTATSAVAATASIDCSITAPIPAYNDTLLVITASQIMQPVEMRIAREVKACLDSYATVKGGKYPWAVPTQNWYFAGDIGSQFGRIPYQPPITDPDINNFINALGNLQTAVNACVANDNNSNSNALDNAGHTLTNMANALKNTQPTTPAIPSTVTTLGKQAGNNAQSNNMCDIINANPTSNSVQTSLDASNAALISALSGLIATSNSAQSVRCDALFQSGYWQDWKNLVFYQVDDAYRPGGSGTASMQINGAGNYRATVLIARQVFPPKTLPRNTTNVGEYLENPNVHSTANPIVTFETYHTIDSKYQTISNDLVLCLDGGSVNCK
jgi:type II secretory pathway pseudopilin PulG